MRNPVTFDAPSFKMAETLMENNLFDLPTDQTEAPDVAVNHEVPGYPPPARACMVCGAHLWPWNPEKQAYTCGGDQAAHEAYSLWHQATFPRLQPAARELS